MTSRLIKADTERAWKHASEQAHQVDFLRLQQPTTKTTLCAVLLMDRHRDTIAAQLLQVTNPSIARRDGLRYFLPGTSGLGPCWVQQPRWSRITQLAKTVVAYSRRTPSFTFTFGTYVLGDLVRHDCCWARVMISWPLNKRTLSAVCLTHGQDLAKHLAPTCS